jgi:very-short-patch-repair endonuclease
MPNDDDPRVRDLAESQDDVLSRAQLRDLAITRHRVHSEVRARRWRIVGQTVVLHRGPLTRRQRLWIAVLHLGPDAALCAWTALECAGLRSAQRSEIHVVVRRGHRIRTLPDMVVHESRRFDFERDAIGVGLPRTSPARSVVDASAWSATPRAAVAILMSAVQQRIVMTEQVINELEQAGKVKHRALLRHVAVDVDGGSRALSELDLTRLLRRSGLPEPRRQRIRTDAQGRRRYLDAEFIRGDGRVVVLEIDGGVHIEASNWWDDQARQTDLVAQDDAVWLRIPAPLLYIDPDRVLRQIADALRLPRPRPVRRNAPPVTRSA